ncbi:MAG TPA: LytTR family transcriptional regulator [Clostridiaceae bacterium]|nr:LytTR family transcriptional regulator [Clostridiaceae bacterium]
MGIELRFIRDDSLGEDIEIAVRAAEKNERVKKLLSSLSDHFRQQVSNQLFLKKYHINTSDIILIMRDGRYVTAKTVEGDHTIKDALTRVEEDLDPAWFVRISQSEIINLKYLKKWDFVGGGVIQVKMEHGIVSYTSRRYAKEIREIFLKRRAKQ